MVLLGPDGLQVEVVAVEEARLQEVRLPPLQAPALEVRLPLEVRRALALEVRLPLDRALLATAAHANEFVP